MWSGRGGATRALSSRGGSATGAVRGGGGNAIRSGRRGGGSAARHLYNLPTKPYKTYAMQVHALEMEGEVASSNGGSKGFTSSPTPATQTIRHSFFTL